MCGIAGALDWASAPCVDDVRSVTDAMVHRGPDAGAIEADGPLVLGHRRLSIIDTRAIANQPMWNRDKSLCIVFNGEIYNFGELRAELEMKSFAFQTNSDTEVILHAYAQYGVECLQRIVGMYAFALWDRSKQRLFIARDRMGEKPLYYHVTREGIIFASELKALRLHPRCPKDINPLAISQFLSLNYILTNTCILNGVEKLPPAHFMLVERGKAPSVREYWSLKNAFLNKPDWSDTRLAQRRLNELLRQSAQGQSISDVPLGAFLSGGIDSSTIVATMAQLNGAELTKTFSIGFKEKSYSELPESERVAAFLQVDYKTRVVDPAIAVHFPRIVASFDEPFADTSMIPTYFLCQFTRENVTVSLSGDGADELFLGYETYVADKLHRVLSGCPDAVLESASRVVDLFWPVSFRKVSFDYKLRQFLRGGRLDFPKSHYFWRTIFSDEEKGAVLRDGLSRASDPAQDFESYCEDVASCEYLDQASYVDMKTWLVDDILIKVDQASMAHSLESRAPFLDHRVVEFAAGLPAKWKLRGFRTKAILKDSQAEHLPRETLHRKKRGFNAPVSNWFSGELMDIGKQATYDSGIRDWIHTAALDKLWNAHANRREDNGLKLFGLASLGLWLEQHRVSL